MQPKFRDVQACIKRLPMGVNQAGVFFIIFFSLLMVSKLQAHGELPILTLNVKNTPLQKVFMLIEKQSGYYFVYNNAQIREAKLVTINVNRGTLEQVLKDCFKDQPFSYAILDKLIVIKSKDQSIKRISQMHSEGGLPIEVRGRVVNEKGEPMVGVSVTIKGSQQGTITDGNGEFVLPSNDPNAILIFSGTNVETYSLSIVGTNRLLVKLMSKISKLDEVQVVAYGTTTRRLSTGNIGTVKAEDIEKQPVNNPLLALEGRIPGLFITQLSGVTGGPVTIRIQGQNSYTAGNDPFIVIDGVPFLSSMPRTGLDDPLAPAFIGGTPSPLNFVNTADIESVDILKDADATAIYGSRAANGAILITTKKGKAGSMKVDVNMQQGYSKAARKMSMLNARQYLDMRYEGFRNDNIDWRAPSVSANDLKIWDTTRSTDWQKVLYGGTACLTNIDAAISGGTANVQYFVGGTYQRNTVVFPGDYSDQRAAVHCNIGTASVNQKLHVQLSANYMYDNNALPGVDLTGVAILLEPVAPSIFNPDGTLNWAPNSSTGNSTWDNPMASALYKVYNNKTNNLVTSSSLRYLVLPGLELKGNLGYTNTQTNDYGLSKLGSIRPENRATTPRSARYGYRTLNSYVFEPQITYKKGIKNSNIDALLGASFQQASSDVRSITGINYNSDAVLLNPSAAATVTALTTIYSLYKYSALFGILNYNWRNEYIINLTARRDGSSRFGDKNQIHNFGSIGGAWIFSQNPFFERLHIPALSFGKIRGSFGTTGSDQIGDYTNLSLYGNIVSAVPYQNSVGLQPANLSNSYLEWEETRKIQVGLDLGFYKDRILLNCTYARNRSSNQLLSYPLTSITGFTSIPSNFPATVQNISWEFSLFTTNVKTSKFTWTSGINLTIGRNKLIDFPNLAQSAYANLLVVGQPLNVTKVYHFAGVDPATGYYKAFDINGAPANTLNSLKDRATLLSIFPKFYGGFQNTFEYRGLAIDVLFQFVKQMGKIVYFNNGSSLTPGGFLSSSSNQPATVLKRWQKPGDMTDIQRFSSNNFLAMSAASGSDAFYGDASYIRLKNVSITYELPASWLPKKSFRYLKIYLQCQNLLTITPYQGLDPESQNLSALPPLRTITFGIRMGF